MPRGRFGGLPVIAPRTLWRCRTRNPTVAVVLLCLGDTAVWVEREARNTDQGRPTSRGLNAWSHRPLSVAFRLLPGRAGRRCWPPFPKSHTQTTQAGQRTAARGMLSLSGHGSGEVTW